MKTTHTLCTALLTLAAAALPLGCDVSEDGLDELALDSEGDFELAAEELDEEDLDDEDGVPSDSAADELADAADDDTLASSYYWGWGSVTNVSLDGTGADAIIVEAGQTVGVSLDYAFFPGLAGCPNCITQLIAGMDGSSDKECLISMASSWSGSSSFDLVAPTALGFHDLWVEKQWQYNCADALAITSDGASVGSVLVVDPSGYDWGWGHVDNVSVAGTGANTATVAPGQSFTIEFDYDYNPGLAGCSSCQTQLVTGMAGSTDEQCYNGYAGARQGHQVIQVTAPVTPGVYPLWVSPQWQYTCTDAMNVASGGGTYGAIRVG